MILVADVVDQTTKPRIRCGFVSGDRISYPFNSNSGFYHTPEYTGGVAI